MKEFNRPPYGMPEGSLKSLEFILYDLLRSYVNNIIIMVLTIYISFLFLFICLYT